VANATTMASVAEIFGDRLSRGVLLSPLGCIYAGTVVPQQSGMYPTRNQGTIAVQLTRVRGLRYRSRTWRAGQTMTTYHQATRSNH
jgi:hypothetical protein